MYYVLSPCLPPVPVVVGFNQVSYTARETDEPLGVVVNVSSPVVLRRNVTITVQTIPGTASQYSLQGNVNASASSKGNCVLANEFCSEKIPPKFPR